jgi:hypothetical protein
MDMKHPAVNELVQDPAAPYQALRAAIKSEMHCALPGIVQSFDASTQTATIQPAIRTRVTKETGVENVQLPLLANVPVYFPGGGQYALTMPVQSGDECLVVFADSCIDAWWQSGGVQNQIDLRSHDISDGFAFVGFRSRAKVLNGVPENEPAVIGDPGALKGPKGDDGRSVFSAGFSGNDLVFTLSDNSTVTITGAKALLTGPAGSDATVTKQSVENVLIGNITSHGHTPQHIGAAPTSHTHSKANITDFAHTHTPAEAGAAPASHNHNGVYVPVGGAAYPLRIGGVQMNFNWSGQGGQPPWLWGGSDGTNMYVYNPSNFSVNYANTAGGLSSYSYIVNLIYPVGSIYMSTSATNPGNLFGGSWERYAVGRVLVGVSEGEGEFAGPGYAGGEKYHALTINEMPYHNHRFRAWSYQTDASRADYYGANQNLANDNFDPNQDHIGYAGSGWGHNNMQPYIAVYIWRRIG